MGTLTGRVAIVTGASRGLGKDIAVSLGRAGARVLITARTENEGDSQIPGSLSRTAQLVHDAGGEAVAVRCDVSRDEDIEAAVQRAAQEFGRIDILVNNAGIQVPGTIAEMQPRHFDLIYRVNVRGPFVFCRTVLPHLIRRGGGHIINISSGGAIGPKEGPYAEPGTGGTPYGTTKAALERFSQGLASEVFHENIAVNALSPSRPEWSEGGHYVRTLGGREFPYSGWRLSGEIIGDAVVAICQREPQTCTGRILYDEQVLIEDGMTEAAVAERYPVQQ